VHVLDENDAAEQMVHGWNKVPADGAGAEDGSDYHVMILVGADFGCIHYKKREVSSADDQAT
jgi:hypothetical protein